MRTNRILSSRSSIKNSDITGVVVGFSLGISTMMFPKTFEYIMSMGHNCNHHKIWAYLTGGIAAGYIVHGLYQQHQRLYNSNRLGSKRTRSNILEYIYIALLGGVSISAISTGFSDNVLYRKDCVWFNPLITAYSYYAIFLL